ncbi:Axonemal 84 kDa protein [Eumeta japonica]|uniref:Axonemal 84 kDa protein n=1 Tax=Eumeta variegata TaxID=151549 RepID=A0A4C1X1S1_EUMVA|nr:Axonemal 84 kDa protein [Eumeta japonica]
MNISSLPAVFVPKGLEAVKYQVQYRAPAAPPGVTRTPEEIEAEMKRAEAEYEKLALVNIESVDSTMSRRSSTSVDTRNPKGVNSSNKLLGRNMISDEGQAEGSRVRCWQWWSTVIITPKIIDCRLDLVFSSRSLPEDVIWSEPPAVCQWRDDKSVWTTSYINDYKFNEDKLNVQFRTGVLWPIGLATVKYNNMPYQNWELKPDPYSQGVLITVTGMYVTVTFQCLGNSVKLMKVSAAGTNYMADHYKKPYGVKRLLQIMKEAACDFFPDFDAHNQIDGSCPKEWICERHNYHAMASLSRAYNFQWSRCFISFITLSDTDPLKSKPLAMCLVNHDKPMATDVFIAGDYGRNPLSLRRRMGLRFHSFQTP